jgi:O-antigen ligase
VYLYSDNLLILIEGQAIYFALYLNASLVFLWHLYSKKILGRLKNLYLFIVAPVYVLLIFLLASRASIAILVCLVLIIGGFLILHQRKYVLGLLLIGGFMIGSLALAYFFPKTINRFKSLTYFHFEYDNPDEVYHFNEEEFANRWNGLTVRLAIWSCVREGIWQSPVIGTGPGDYMTTLKNCYTTKNFILGLKHDYSPHNQYLQIALSLGVVGLAVFLFSLLYPLQHAYRQKDHLYVLFLLLILLNMITEDLWGTFRGVVFFSFINALLLFQNKPKASNQDTQL